MIHTVITLPGSASRHAPDSHSLFAPMFRMVRSIVLVTASASGKSEPSHGVGSANPIESRRLP